MKSPFPGMDPYIEQHNLWRDFHTNLMTEIQKAISHVLPRRYRVRTEERVYVVLAEVEEKDTHPFYPDLTVTTFSDSPNDVGAEAASGEHGGAVQMLALVEERYRENFIEIHEVGSDERLVTSVEILSPSNKRRGTEGWDLYLRKRQALLLGAANLVEIDLLRGGQRMPMVTPWPRSPYYVLVCRRRRAPYCSVWPATFRERLPRVKVPLLDPDPDLEIDIQPMIEEIYERSRYETSIDYTKPLPPPVSDDEAAWLADQLPAAPAKRPPSRRRKKS